MVMSEMEICCSYKNSKESPKQIKVLAQLNDVKKCVIEKILINNGFDQTKIFKIPKNVTWSDADTNALINLINAAKTMKEASVILNIPYANVHSKVKVLGLDYISQKGKVKGNKSHGK
jgi:hypothetical protein